MDTKIEKLSKEEAEARGRELEKTIYGGAEFLTVRLVGGEWLAYYKTNGCGLCISVGFAN